jgi:hypothetical protein
MAQLTQTVQRVSQTVQRVSQLVLELLALLVRRDASQMMVLG